jgi:hypothetical protein
VNAGQKGNDANQIRDQQVVGSLDTQIGKVNAPRSCQPFPHHLRDLQHDVESRSVGTRAELALNRADAVIQPTVARVVCRMHEVAGREAPGLAPLGQQETASFDAGV